VKIREMGETDLPHVMAIERVSFPSPWTEAMFVQQLLLGETAINLVCEVEKSDVARRHVPAEAAVRRRGTRRPLRRIVGYAASWIAFDEIHLLSIAVAPDERHNGYATSLLADVVRRGREAGARRIILEVRVGNTSARTFYERRGFAVIGVRKRYYVDTGEDAVVMEWIFEDG
jgi:ribosomal-protein-alanine N-acetyltransferase